MKNINRILCTVLAVAMLLSVMLTGCSMPKIVLPGTPDVAVTYGDGKNVLGPGGTANSTFSESDLRALELLGWSVNREVTIPEPTTATLSLLALAGLAARRRRASR